VESKGLRHSITVDEAIRIYPTFPLHKAIAIARDSEEIKTFGYSYGYRDINDAIDGALSYCNKGRKNSKVHAECRLYAVDNEVVWSASEGSEIDKARVPRATTGTGFCVGDDGLILTSYHVVGGAASITVRLADGRVVPAEIKQASQSTDLAILKVNAKTPVYLCLSAPRAVKVGDRVFTMGYPFVNLLGGEPKFTEGSISSLSGVVGEASLLQITVPIQPGNSGGPLVDDKGNVVGIITSTAAAIPFFKETGSLPQNVNWAVKSELASLLFDQSLVECAQLTDRREVIKRVQGAICGIEATK